MIRPNYSLLANNHDRFLNLYRSRQSTHHDLDFPHCNQDRNILLEKKEKDFNYKKNTNTNKVTFYNIKINFTNNYGLNF